MIRRPPCSPRTAPRLPSTTLFRSPLHLGIADSPAGPAGRLHYQKAGHREVALEGAADLAVLDRGVALEQAGLADLQALAVAQVGLDPALDHQLLAGLDLARQADLAADHEFAALDRRRRAARRRLGGRGAPIGRAHG